MSAPTTAVPLVVRGWTAGRVRRAKMFGLLLAAAAILALWSAYQPWYGFSTSGPVNCSQQATATPAKTITVRTQTSNSLVSGVSASGCITGRGIAQAASATPPAATRQQMAVLAQQNTAVQPAVWFGLPRCVALVALAALAGIAALFLRNGWIGVIAIVGFYYAHGDLGALENVMTSGAGGALNTPQRGLALFGWALLLGWGLLTASTVFVLKHNHEARADAKKAALAAGEKPPASPLDHLATFVGGKIARGIDAARSEHAQHEHAVHEPAVHQ